MTIAQLTRGIEILNEINSLKAELTSLEKIEDYEDVSHSTIDVLYMNQHRKFEIERQDMLECLWRRRAKVNKSITELEEELNNL